MNKENEKKCECGHWETLHLRNLEKEKCVIAVPCSQCGCCKFRERKDELIGNLYKKKEDRGRYIKKIIVKDVGSIFYNPESFDEKERLPIEHFSVNGEMALVSWYKQGDREFNGKYVIEIEYADK